MVVMKPWSNPKTSSNTLAIGAKQFVVQDALLMIRSSEVKMSSFTPKTIVFISPFAGALMTTFPAPASKCKPAFSALVKTPVDSTTTSIFNLPHGKSAGFRSAVICTSWPFTINCPLETDTSPSNRPWMLSNFSKCAKVATSVRSLMATTRIPSRPSI